MSTVHAFTFARRSPARLVLLSIAAVVALSACGNKGPLVLPDKPGAPAAAPAATPVPPPSPDETASPLPPSDPPAATDPVLDGADDDGNG